MTQRRNANGKLQEVTDMPFEQQLVAGATEFDGTAGQGLFTFSDISLFASLSYGIKIHSVFVNCDGAAPLVQIFAGFSGTPAAERRLLASETGNSVGITCEFIQPKSDVNAPMSLFIITTGKSAAGRAEVHWSPGVIV